MARVRTRSYYIRLPEDLAHIMQREADRLRMPFTTYVRLRLTELYQDELEAMNDAKIQSDKPGDKREL